MENDNLDSVKAFEKKMFELNEKKNVILMQIRMNMRNLDFDVDKNNSLFKELNEIDGKIEEALREEIRVGIDNIVKEAITNSGTKDPFSLGRMVQVAIGFYYQSMKDEAIIKGVKDELGVDYSPILEEECQKALKKYKVNIY